MIPPGDIRNCLAALSDNHSRIADIFQYRFGSGEGLNGHAIGNLVLTALADVTNDFPRAVEIAARDRRRARHRAPRDHRAGHARRGVRGRPRAERRNHDRGGRRTHPRGVGLLPERPRCLPEVCEALLPRRRDRGRTRQPVHERAAAAARARRRRRRSAPRAAIRILVANLMTEPGETDDYSVLEHVLTIERHLGAQLFDYVIYNTTPGARAARRVVRGRAARRRSSPATFELNALDKLGIQPIGVPLVSEHPAGKIRHHPERLAVGHHRARPGQARRVARPRRGREASKCTNASISCASARSR